MPKNNLKKDQFHEHEWLTSLFLSLNGDLKSDHLKFGKISNLDYLKVRFQMVRFSNGQALAMALAIVPNLRPKLACFEWHTSKNLTQMLKIRFEKSSLRSGILKPDLNNQLICSKSGFSNGRVNWMPNKKKSR